MRHRTALIAAGSIAAVVFAGAIAIGANLGILTFADSSPVGQLTTATVTEDAAAQQVQEYAPASTDPGAKKQRATQEYVIKKAGTVKIAFSKKAVRFVDAAAKSHWTWTLSQTSDRKLTVTFERGSSTYTFVASVGRNGKLAAKVDHPVTKVLPSSTGGAQSWASAQPAAPAAPSTAAPANTDEREGGSSGQGEADD